MVLTCHSIVVDITSFYVQQIYCIVVDFLYAFWPFKLPFGVLFWKISCSSVKCKAHYHLELRQTKPTRFYTSCCSWSTHNWTQRCWNVSDTEYSTDGLGTQTSEYLVHTSVVLSTVLDTRLDIGVLGTQTVVMYSMASQSSTHYMYTAQYLILDLISECLVLRQ